jgi:hypothetical protein
MREVSSYSDLAATPSSAMRRPTSFRSRSDIPSGFPGNLSPEQQSALTWFKQQLDTYVPNFVPIFNIQPDDYERWALKWLRASKFNKEEALKACQRCVLWRESLHGIGVNNISKEACEKELAKGKLRYTGRGVENRPVMWIDAHLHKKNEVPPKEVELAAIWAMEHEALGRLDKTIPGSAGETVNLVVDLSQFGRSNVDMDGMKFFAELFTNYYPEVLNVCVIVDAPWIFNAVWKATKAWLDPVTAAKAHFISRADLEKWIPRDAWPPGYGSEIERSMSMGAR